MKFYTNTIYPFKDIGILNNTVEKEARQFTTAAKYHLSMPLKESH